MFFDRINLIDLIFFAFLLERQKYLVYPVILSKKYILLYSSQVSGPQALPLRLKKNLRLFLILLENILGEKYVPATFLLISPIVG